MATEGGIRIFVSLDSFTGARVEELDLGLIVGQVEQDLASLEN